MPTVHVALEEGFEDDEVEVRVADQLVRRAGVTTLTVIGLADQVDVPVPEGRWRVAVRLPGRGVSTEVPVTVDGDVLVRVSVTPGGLAAEQVTGTYGWA